MSPVLVQAQQELRYAHSVRCPYYFVTLAILLLLAGILGTVIPGLPGAVLVLTGLLWLAWLDEPDRLGAGTIVLLVLLTVAFHAIDPLATAVGAKRFGLVVVGAFVGTKLTLIFMMVGIAAVAFLFG